MPNHVIQYDVYDGSPITAASDVTVSITHSETGLAATVTSDRDGLIPTLSEFTVSVGHFRVYAPPGRYNIRATNSSNDMIEYLDVEVGEWST